MSFLKKFGDLILKIFGISQGAVPLIAQYFPGAAGVVGKAGDFLGGIIAVLGTTEQVFEAAGQQKSGGDKLKAAVPYVATLIQQSEALAGKKIKDEAKFTAAVTGITSNFADLLNAYE